MICDNLVVKVSTSPAGGSHRRHILQSVLCLLVILVKVTHFASPLHGDADVAHTL